MKKYPELTEVELVSEKGPYSCEGCVYYNSRRYQCKYPFTHESQITCRDKIYKLKQK